MDTVQKHIYSNYHSPSSEPYRVYSTFVSPRNRVAQLYPRALGSLYFTSYDSQGSYSHDKIVCIPYMKSTVIRNSTPASLVLS
jgi:hypothetical protein